MILALELCLPKATFQWKFQKKQYFFGIKSIKSITFKELIP